ncbi:MAG: class I SAM-dependent methyltransferase [Microthrixaceae bacterium]
MVEPTVGGHLAIAPMDEGVRKSAEAARGFMPPDEGLALYEAGLDAALAVPGAPLLEVGSYCGKSSIYLGEAARLGDTVLVAVDHHRGSEENQPGWEWHEPDLVDPELGVMDTLPSFRRATYRAGLEPWIVALVGNSPTVGRFWSTPCAFVFIDGGHGEEPARIDYEVWTPHVALGGTLAIHDVFPDPADGGRPPYEQIYLPAIESGLFEEIRAVGSLRILRRTA